MVLFSLIERSILRVSGARLAGGFLSALLLASHAGGTGILVTPAQMGLVVNPGETALGVFRVSASRSEKTQVHVRIVDFEKTPGGDTVQVTKAPERSCAAWVRVEPLVFQTAESGWTEVRVSVSVPADVRGTYWALAIFQVEPAAGTKFKGRTVIFRPQLQVPLLVTARGTETRGARIENVKAVLAPDGTVEASADVVNTGNTGLMPTGSWVLERGIESSGRKEEVQEKELASFLLLPGHSYRANERLALSGPASRDLSLHLYMVYGVEKGQVAEVTVPVEAPAPLSAPAVKATPKPAKKKEGSPRS